MRIELCGAIGTGKTTLAEKLSAARAGWMVVKEPVETNPFLATFYTDPAKYGFENALFFAGCYIHHVKKYESRDAIYDAGDALNRAYVAIKGFGAAHAEAFAAMDKVAEELPPPDLVIHMTCPAEEVLARIKRRGRGFEAGVTLDFIKGLQAEIDRQVTDQARRRNVPVLILDMMELDVVNRPEDVAIIWQKIDAAINSSMPQRKSRFKNAFGGPK